MAAERVVPTVVRNADGEWRPAKTPGLEVKLLRRDKATEESSFLIRLAPGARIPAHDHPAGEELYVLEGDFHVGPESLGPGDYLYTPANGIHAAHSKGGCVVLVVLPKPVRILED
jgi:quercetin dioxygenase-like cupin family protein